MRNFLCPIILLSGLVMIGCSDEAASPSDDPESFEAQKKEAMTTFENRLYDLSQLNVATPDQIGSIDFETPANSMKTLLGSRPDDPDLNVAFAMSEMFALYRDEHFRALLISMRTSGAPQVPVGAKGLDLGFLPFNMMAMMSADLLAGNMITMVRKGMMDPGGMAVWQQHFKNNLLPRIERASRSFGVAETYQPAAGGEYQFALTGKMYGFPTGNPRYMDKTEIYLMHAYLEYMAFNLRTYLLIDFSASDFMGIDPDSMEVGVLPDEVVFMADAEQQGNAAMANMENTFLNLTASVEYLIGENDDQSDDVIAKNPSLTNGMLLEFIVLLNQYYEDIDFYLGYLQSLIKNADFPELPESPGFDF